MIRIAKTSDAADLLEIYATYVEQTAITFELVPPSLQEFEHRIAETLENYPYFVYVNSEGRIDGYTYCHIFHGRPAYIWSVETSIYVRRGVHGKGIGRQLYDKLESTLRQQNIVNLYASIVENNGNDKYVTNESRDFHAHLGYAPVACFRQSGYKFDQWHDVLWMHKRLVSEIPSPPPPFIPFCKLGLK